MGDDECNITISGEKTDVGSNYEAVATIDNNNYSLSNPTTTFEITPMPITATITSNGGVYAGTITPASATLSDSLTADEAGLVLTYKGNTNAGVAYNSTTAPDQAGTYKVYATITNANYALSETSADFNIERAESGLRIGDIPEKHFLDEDFDLEVTHDSDGNLFFESSDNSVATVSNNGNVSIKGVGTVKFTVEIAETVNYKSGSAEVEMTVKKVPHTINVPAVQIAKTYGDAGFNLGITAGDTEADIKYEATDKSIVTIDESGNVAVLKAGDTDITVSMEDSDNYSASSKTISVTVSPKSITVKAKDSSKKYNTADPTFEYEVLNEGLVGSDTLSGIQVNREAGEDYKQSGYTITASVDKSINSNYDISFETGTFMITQIDLVSADVSLGKALRYTGKELTQEVAKVVVDDIDVPDSSYEVSNNSATDEGVYRLTITALADTNFTGSVEWTYVVAPEIIEAEEGVLELGSGKISLVHDTDVQDFAAEFKDGFSSVVDNLLDGETISADELSAIADGAEMEIVWTVKDNSSTIDENSKNALIEMARKNDFQVGRYINLALSKVITVDGETFEDVITETSEDIEIVLSVPKDLINDDTYNVERKYDVLRNHGEPVDILGAAFDADNESLLFRTNKFSDYALAYADTIITHEVAGDAASPSQVQPENVKTASPITGDSLRAMLVVLLFMLAYAIAAALISFRNKRHTTITGLHYRR